MKALSLACCLWLHGCVTSASVTYGDGDRVITATVYFRDSGKRVIPSK